MKVLYDITTPIHQDMPVYEGDDPIETTSILTIEESGIANITGIVNFTTHFGTHVDPPLHFVQNGQSLDDVPLERFCGVAKVIEIEEGGNIDERQLRQHLISPNDIVLFKTDNSRRRLLEKKDFHTDHAYISQDGAEYLVQKKVKMVGVDYLSVDKYGDESFPAHNTLLRNGVVILESANLVEVEPSIYYLICLPLKIRGADGAPARAVLLEVTRGVQVSLE